MRRSLSLAALLSTLGGVACAPPAPAGTVGASIALLAGGEVVVVDPDQGSVSVLDPESLETVRAVDVGEEPRALLVSRRGTVLVTTRRGGELVELDGAATAVARRAALCDGPFGIAEAADGSVLAVACEWEGTVRAVDPATLSSRVLASGLQRPRALAIVGGAVLAAELTGGRVVRVELTGAQAARSLVPASAPERPALTSMTADLAEALAVDDGTLFVAHELVNHTGDTSAEQVADDYGTVTDGAPKINPAVTALGTDLAARAVPVLYARFDGGARVFNGPSALAPLGDGLLLVAHRSSGNVAVLDGRATTSDARVRGAFKVGAGPGGLAVDGAHRRAFVDNAFDGSVSRLDLSAPFAPAATAALTRVRAASRGISAAALAGRKLFYDATNPHVTPSGVVACATCHPGGGEDGLIWFLHTSRIPLKRRRTPDLGNAHTGTAPFHWDGQFASISDLVRATVTDLMAGDGLLVDGDSVAAFVDELVLPPVHRGEDPAQVARGQALFQSATLGCASCHPAPTFTDNLEHTVLAPVSLSPDDGITTTNTPGLRGVFLRAPYFHDGRAPDLKDALTRPDAAPHAPTQTLAPDDLDALVAYLKSL